MHGYRFHSWGEEPTWEAMPDPAPGPGEALVEVEACGVGLTVLNCIAGDLNDGRASLPRVPGHELVGHIVEVGLEVPRERIGARVVAYFYLFCGFCDQCRQGFEQRCENLAGWVGVHRDGGYAPLTALPARNLMPLPDGIDPVDATVVPDAVATPVHVSRRARIAEPDRVAVIGAGGGVGAHMIQVASLHAAEVAGLEVEDDKLGLIAELGAVPIRSDTLPDLAPEIFAGNRPSVIVDLVGTKASMRWSLEALDVGGRLVALTTFRGRGVGVESRELVFREIELVGSRYATRREVSEAAELVARGDVRPILGRVVEGNEAVAMHEAIRGRELLGRGAIDWRSS